MFEFKAEIVRPFRIDFFFDKGLAKIHIVADRITVYKSEVKIVNGKPTAKPQTRIITFIGEELFLLIKGKFVMKKTCSMSYEIVMYGKETEFVTKW